MTDNDSYRPGDHYVTCDRTGRQIRVSDSKKEWTGALVHKDEWEPRHPQDFVKARPERAPPKNLRPEPTDHYMGPLTTTVITAAAAGTRYVYVVTTARFVAGDRVTITLDNKDTWMTTLLGVAGSTRLVLTDLLPCSISVDAIVVNYTAVAEPDLG